MYKAQKTQNSNTAGPLNRKNVAGLMLLKAKADTPSSPCGQSLCEPRVPVYLLKALSAHSI